MPTTDYNNLPKADFQLLKTFSSSQITTRTSSTIVMLNSPTVGNQGSQGSCVGWALGYSAMGILTYPKTLCWNNALRSPSYVYNQIKANSNCGSGAYMTTGLNLVKNNGDCSWNLMPYNANDCSSLPNVTQNNDAAQNKAINWVALNRNNSNGIKDALDLGFPIVVGFNVTTAFDSMWANGGNWTTNSGTSRGGHAVCIVGYDETKQMFKVQNQWGNGGTDGYFWVTYNLVNNNCFSEVYIVYGGTPALNPEINGVTCLDTSTSNTSSNYTIGNLPTNGVSVTWSATPSNAVIINTPNSIQTTLTKSSGGAFTLKATLNSTCSGFVSSSITKNLSYPIAAPTNITATPNSYGYNINCSPPGYYKMDYVDLVTNSTGTTYVSTGSYSTSGGNFFYYVSPPKSFKFTLTSWGQCNQPSGWITVVPNLCNNNYPTGLSFTTQSVCNGTPGHFCGYGNFMWTPISDATQYQVEYQGINLTNASQPVLTGNFLTTVSNTVQPTQYGGTVGTWILKFRVRSKCPNGTWSDYSPWSSNFSW